jgi:hypothetical protein
MSPLRLEKRVPEENQHRFYRKRCLRATLRAGRGDNA